MGRALGLICGAGTLPARMAREARRQGWRVVACAFADAPGLADAADVLVPSRIGEVGPVLGALGEHRVSAVVFAGRFRMADLLAEAHLDAAHVRLATRAGALVDANMAAAVDATLAGLGITLLDQRGFLGDTAAGAGAYAARQPTDAEWADVRRGVAVARALADAGVGQTVVVRRGVVAAAEAIEGTTEAIRRGTALAGPGAVVVKVTARDHDYRFDVPCIGPETIEAAAAGGASVVAVEAERVVVLDRALAVERADAAGIALVGVAP